MPLERSITKNSVKRKEVGKEYQCMKDNNYGINQGKIGFSR